MNSETAAVSKIILALIVLIGVGAGAGAYVILDEPAESAEADITVTVAEGGTVIGAGTYQDGETVTLTAAAASGYYFSCWTEGSATISNNATLTFTAAEDRELRAVFIIYTYIISVASNHADAGVLTGAGQYQDGETVTLTAVASHGYYFSHWSEGSKTIDNNPTLTFTAAEDREIRAVFGLCTYTVAIVSNYADAGMLSGAGTYTYHTVHTLSATVNSGYAFEGWYENGKMLASAISLNYTIEDNRTLTVRYSIIHDASFVLSASASEAPLTLTVSSVYDVQIQSRTWSCTDTLTGETVWSHSGRGISAVSHSFDHGEGLSISQTVAYTDGVKAISSQQYVVDQTVSKNFEWHYQVKTWYSSLTSSWLNNREATFDLNFSYAWYYNYYTSTALDRDYNSGVFASYVTYRDPTIVALANSLKNLTADLSDLERANCVLKFVQSIEYLHDSDSHGVAEYYKYPAETLYEQNGDCEDHAFLFAALMKAMGYQVVLYHLTGYDDGETVGHLAAGAVVSGASGYNTVFGGQKYYYCEATADSAGVLNHFDIGEKPSNMTITATYEVK